MLQSYDLNRINGFVPFNICMLGARRSGKSVASYKLTEYLRPRFDLIISFLGTKNCNQELCDFIGKHYDPRLNFVEFKPRVLQTLLAQQEDHGQLHLFQLHIPFQMTSVFFQIQAFIIIK